MKNFMTIKSFPFQVQFNLIPLIRFWESLAESQDHIQAKCAQTVVDNINQNPDLNAISLNKSVIEQHKDLVALMFTGIFSPYQIQNGIFAANIPYTMDVFFGTTQFNEMMSTDQHKINNLIFGRQKGDYYGPTMHAYTLIFKKYFNLDVSFDIPTFKFRLQDQETGLMKYFSMKTDISFVDIKYNGKKKQLTDEEIQTIRENFLDLSVWMKIVPPEDFVFEGFGLLNVSEDTQQQSVISIQNELLDKESIINAEKFNKIELRMKSLLQMPDIKMGMAVFNEDPKAFTLFRNTWNSIIKDDGLLCEQYMESIYQKAGADRQPLVITDLKTIENKTIIEETLIKEGWRSMLIIPLQYEEELVGFIEIASPRPGAITSGDIVQLHPLVSPFGIAAKRQGLDLENRVKAKIQEDFTAIHHAVEWKFEEVATERLSREIIGEKISKDQIIFRDVYPLYGVSDVKSSSTKRNAAIRADLLEQLAMLDHVLNMVKKQKPLPILDHLRYNLHGMREDIENEISSGDEVKILNFVRREVEPVLKHLSTLREELEGVIGVYFDMLDEHLGILYRQRKDFEESMQRINNEISNLLDERETEAQAMFPHYFEKYRTDGIEHSIYIGDELVQNLDFDPIYLKNIRLWQLMTMCDITRKTAELIPSLPMKLETTQLILVHNQPIAIRFRDDEKKFDVEGAYNLRYEITKKRIDKATIKGTSERIVQPGHIAIIYLQDNERQEYVKYLDYLVANGYIEAEIEQHDLENMQGIYGLHSLRVKVKNPEANHKKQSLSDVEKVVKTLESVN